MYLDDHITSSLILFASDEQNLPGVVNISKIFPCQFLISVCQLIPPLVILTNKHALSF